METIEFISAIKQRVIDGDFSVYRNLLNNADLIKDPIWKAILPVYNCLAEDQKESFLQFFRLIQVNTVSHILGILDGSTYLNEKRESFVLTTDPGGEVISGDLQDMFLEIMETYS